MDEGVQQHLDSLRPAVHRRKGRKPAYEAAKDSGLHVSDVLAPRHRFETVVEHRGPCAIVVLEMDAEPRVLGSGHMTEADRAALNAWLVTDWRALRLMQTLDDLDLLED